MIDPGASDTCPRIAEVQAPVAADGGNRDGTANMAVPIQLTEQSKRTAYFSHHVVCSSTHHVLHLGFPVWLCAQAAAPRNEVILIHTSPPRFPQAPSVYDYFSLAFIGNGALLGTLHRV